MLTSLVISVWLLLVTFRYSIDNNAIRVSNGTVHFDTIALDSNFQGKKPNVSRVQSIALFLFLGGYLNRNQLSRSVLICQDRSECPSQSIFQNRSANYIETLREFDRVESRLVGRHAVNHDSSRLIMPCDRLYNPDDMEKGQRQNEAFKSPNGPLFPHLIPSW